MKKRAMLFGMILIIAVIVLAVAAIAVDLAQSGHLEFYVCHSNVSCTTPDQLICEICGQVRGLNHTMYRKSCTEIKCAHCDYKETVKIEQHVAGKAYLTNADACEVSIACADCGKYYITHKHNMQEKYIQCKVISVCTFCGKQGTVVGESHSWVSNNCSSGATCLRCGKWRAQSARFHKWVDDVCATNAYCKVCGMENPQPREQHNYDYPFLRVFGVCMDCGQWQYESRNFDWLSRVAEVLAVALIAFAFQYVVRRRKYMHISWLTVIVMWLTENSCFGSFSPAVLWKKKLD